MFFEEPSPRRFVIKKCLGILCHVNSPFLYHIPLLGLLNNLEYLQ